MSCRVGSGRFARFFLFFFHEMGLGKTVEVIGCLMSNPWKPGRDVPLKPPPQSTRAGQHVHDLTGQGQAAGGDAPLPPVQSESGELGTTACEGFLASGAFFGAYIYIYIYIYIIYLLCSVGHWLTQSSSDYSAVKTNQYIHTH